tara:strand:+ start:945 stop:1145 length:201 start_codon:yes stop_codon:yes gene_type:complete
MILKIKNLIAKILAFSTGLGYYGLGLLAGGIGAITIGWSFIGAGLIGAFIYKNYAAIVAHFKGIFN